jgi:hypothetical protein
MQASKGSLDYERTLDLPITIFWQIVEGPAEGTLCHAYEKSQRLRLFG